MDTNRTVQCMDLSGDLEVAARNIGIRLITINDDHLINCKIPQNAVYSFYKESAVLLNDPAVVIIYV